MAMNTHPYLRAFLAGVFVPTLVLPVMLSGFIVLRLGMHVQVPVERGIVFPMALVPSLFGLWNMLWLGSHLRTHLPIGFHGALLPIFMAPVGALVASCLGILALGRTGATWFQSFEVPYVMIAAAFLTVLCVYYLVWKYIVGFVNRTLGIA